MSIRYYPLEVSALTKGQTISIKELEVIFGVKFPEIRWWSRLLRLKKQIAHQRELLGLPTLTMNTPKGMLHVCTDEEASEYNRRHDSLANRKKYRHLRQNLAVDTSKFTEEQRQIHDRTIRRQAMVVSAIRSAQRRVLPQVELPKRITPPMFVQPKMNGVESNRGEESQNEAT